MSRRAPRRAGASGAAAGAVGALSRASCCGGPGCSCRASCRSKPRACPDCSHCPAVWSLHLSACAGGGQAGGDAAERGGRHYGSARGARRPGDRQDEHRGHAGGVGPVGFAGFADTEVCRPGRMRGFHALAGRPDSGCLGPGGLCAPHGRAVRPACAAQSAVTANHDACGLGCAVAHCLTGCLQAAVHAHYRAHGLVMKAAVHTSENGPRGARSGPTGQDRDPPQQQSN